MPSGLVLTVLATQGFQGDSRDDVSYSQTISSVIARLNISTIIKNPIDSSEDFALRMSKAEMDNFKVRLTTLIKSSEEALEEQDKERSCKIWVREFGERFQIVSSDKKDERLISPAIIKNPPKPWCQL